jgi:hypothetical protein
MIAEKPERYPRGTYKLLLMKRLDYPDAVSGFQLINLATGRRIRSSMVWDLVRFMEDDITANKYPECAIQYRTWNVMQNAGRIRPDNAEGFTANKAGENRETVISSFMIQVMYRQNATWQGSVQWMEGMQTRQYRSVNELLSLMSEAVGISSERLESTPQEA